MTTTAGIYPVTINGRTPCGERVERIRQAVWTVPNALVRAWLARGGRMELISGINASVHPANTLNRSCLGWHRRGGFIVVAADHTDAEQTARHELGHSIDETLGYPSRSAEWLEIWRRDLAIPGRVDKRFRAEAFEWFAESVALSSCGYVCADDFQTEADRFIGRLAFQFCQ